jgi:asparagine synthase (glutamine-hydrolysing)
VIYGTFNFIKQKCNRNANIGSLDEKLSWGSSIFSSKRILSYPTKDNFFYCKSLGTIILFDGFVYNIAKLANKLNNVNSNSNTPKIIAKAFLEWGPRFAEKLNGDFAICVCLEKKNELYFFRDHLGLRPLSVAKIGSKVYFSTDPLGLSKALFQDELIDPDFITNRFLFEGFRYELMPNKQVIKVLPGHYLRVTPNEMEMRPYWHPEKIKTDHSLTFEQVVSDLKALLEDAVKIRVDHDFTAAAHISGGLDSGIVASLARKHYPNQKAFYGFSWTPLQSGEPEKVEFDERKLVFATCQKANIKPVFTTLKKENYLVQLSSWKYPSEMIFEQEVVQKAKEKGINLIFSGWGGDEFISCGNRGVDADLIRQFTWKSFLKKYQLRKPKRLLGALVFNVIFPSWRRTYSKYKTDPLVYQYIRKRLASNIIPRKERFKYNSRRRVHLQLLAMYHLANRAEDWYLHGKQHGIEYRYPLLDKRIVEYMLKVPSNILVNGNNHRILLRELAKGILPEAVLKNKSKDDPVKSHYFRLAAGAATKELIGEVDEFRKNPELSHVDFDLLDKNIRTYLEKNSEENLEQISGILYYLKSAHEFTKGYYGKD